jgi:hypothetical protein
VTPFDAWFDVITPLGPATCIGIIDDVENVEWVTFIKATGEPWFFRNPHIRYNNDATNGRPTPSPFTELGPKLSRQVDRYKRNGWLPSDELPSED